MTAWLETGPAFLAGLGGLLALGWRRFRALGLKRPLLGPQPPAGSGKALVHCLKSPAPAAEKAVYQGPPSCLVVSLYEAGVSACPYGCFGYGDCLAVCPAGALSIAGPAVVVNEKLCRGCGRCLKACPQKLIRLVPQGARITIPCLTQTKMKNVSRACQAGCLGCLQCLKACPARALTRAASGPPVIDHDRCQAFGRACGLACLHKCPRGIIKQLGGDSPDYKQAGSDETGSDGAGSKRP